MLSEASVQDWIGVVRAKAASIERGSPWENCFIESFNAGIRDEFGPGQQVHQFTT
jgi:hypothetical protein